MFDDTVTVGFKHRISTMQKQRAVWQDEDEEPLDGTYAAR